MALLYTDNHMNKVRIIQKIIDNKISISDAASALNCSERTIYRYQSTLINEWPSGFIHWLKWKPPNHNPSSSKFTDIDKIISKNKFSWFWPTLLSEKLFEIYGIVINKESLRKRMIKLWLWLPNPKKIQVKRTKRQRSNGLWLLIQLDWSYHDWFEDWSEYCLINAIDDATGKTTFAKFTSGESLINLYEFIKDYIKINWKPNAIYLDRHSTYKVNHPRDQFDKEMVTRFQKACHLLNIHVIYSKTPEWKWRVENSFKTHQDRLIKELRLAWIKDIDNANKFLLNYYIPKHNNKFSVSPKINWDFHVTVSDYEYNSLEWFFAKNEYRSIKRDWTISYNKQKYQIHKKQHLPWWRKVSVVQSILWKVKILSWDKELLFDIVN